MVFSILDEEILALLYVRAIMVPDAWEMYAQRFNELDVLARAPLMGDGIITFCAQHSAARQLQALFRQLTISREPKALAHYLNLLRRCTSYEVAVTGPPPRFRGSSINDAHSGRWLICLYRMDKVNTYGSNRLCHGCRTGHSYDKDPIGAWCNPWNRLDLDAARTCMVGCNTCILGGMANTRNDAVIKILASMFPGFMNEAGEEWCTIKGMEQGRWSISTDTFFPLGIMLTPRKRVDFVISTGIFQKIASVVFKCRHQAGMPVRFESDQIDRIGFTWYNFISLHFTVRDTPLDGNHPLSRSLVVVTESRPIHFIRWRLLACSWSA